jgi:hypothetical protein
MDLSRIHLAVLSVLVLVIFGQNFTTLATVLQFTNDFVILLSISIDE